MKELAMRNKREGFTLVELLVVIAIIGLLMALLLPAVQKIRGSGDRTKAISQLNQIATACAQFKADTGFYPPDNAADAAKVLQAMYPRTFNATTYNGGNTLNNPNQFLVHFLAGPLGTGWAIDAPAAPGPSATTKKGPWMTFQTSELAGNTVIDPWGQPLQYRASGSGGAYAAGSPPGGIPAYLDTAGRPFNQGGVQVISGGPNKSPPTGGNLPMAGTPGADDLANFNGGYQLGARP
jgi:prepilin-type N-terminal cleavage/methylation domain-containing protein